MLKFISNIFKSKNKKIEEEAFRYLQKVSSISKQIAAEKNEIKLNSLAFSLKKNYVLPEERKLVEAMGKEAEQYFQKTGRWIWFL